MRILTLNNKSYNLNDLPDVIEEDIRYSVLDNSNSENPDFFFHPLIFMESFNSPAIQLKINNYTIQMPLDWHILVGDQNCGLDPEAIPLTSLNQRKFEAFTFNPMTGFGAEFSEIKIANIFQDVKWFFPKLRNGHYLSVPLGDDENPRCVFFIKDVTKQCESLKIDQIM